MLRAVFDTNLFVSSVLVRAGLPAQALDAWRTAQFLLLTSPPILEEVVATLGTERIRRKYSITDDDVSQLLGLLSAEAVVVNGLGDVAGSVPDDPDDEIVLACAVEGQADVIVSGDKHLLALGTFRDIPVLTVRQFLEELQADEVDAGHVGACGRKRPIFLFFAGFAPSREASSGGQPRGVPPLTTGH